MRSIAYPLLRRVEPLVLRFARLRNCLPPTFIIGGERCGTTLVTLHVAGHFRFGWIPVVAKRRPRHPWTATWRALGRGSWEPNVENRYGVGSGDLAPSDGWDTLKRWFREDGTSPEAIDPTLAEFVTLVRLFERLFDAPFLNKNNSNSLRVKALASAFPTANFLFVTRERVPAVSSLLEARKKHGVRVGEWWGAVPPAFRDRHFDLELEQTVATLVGVEHAIRESLGELDRQRWTELSYEAFCEQPALATDWLARTYASQGVELVKREPSNASQVYRASRMPLEEFQRLAALVDPIGAQLREELASRPKVAGKS